MFPILVYMYARLARTEERRALAEFGDEYRAYLDRTPAFIPRLGAGQATSASHR
jgi:protein-S-isoprenylcysteine O-methyltransferase Ste14